MIKKIYEWLFYLIENTLTPEKGDYLAKINTGRTKTAEDIADRIVQERTEYRRETILNILTMVNNVKKEFLSQGDSINDGITIYEPAITGVFTGETIFDENENACVINARITNEIHKILPQVQATYSGLTLDNGGAVIEKVIDSASATVNEYLSPGKVITILGKKIRVVSEEEERPETWITFENEDGLNVYVVDDPIIVNDPGKVVVQLPLLSQGIYILTIKTLYSNSSTLLKAPRFITFKIKLTVP